MLTVEEFRGFFHSPLGDEAIQKILDDARIAVEERAGPAGEVTAYLSGGGTFLVLPYRADPGSITVTEDWESDSALELADDDWLLGNDGVSLRRLYSGTNSAGGWNYAQNRVVYTRRDETARREIVQRDLAKLAHDYDPLISQESIDGYAYSKASNSLRSYEDEYESILARLDPPDVGFR